MLELAIEGKQAGDIEAGNRPAGPTYTAETLVDLRNCAYEKNQLFFILGMDSSNSSRTGSGREISCRWPLSRSYTSRIPSHGHGIAGETAYRLSRKDRLFEGKKEDISATVIRDKTPEESRWKDWSRQVWNIT
jgi:hypothetical protein